MWPPPSIALPWLSRLEHPHRLQPLGSIALLGGKKSTGKWIYTAQLFHHDAAIYQQEGTSLVFFETLPYTYGFSSPQGTVATPSGMWYVANAGHSNVLIFKTTSSGPTGPNSALDDANQYPVNVDVTPSRRLVAVSNEYSLPSYGTGSVSVYLSRGAEPSRTLTYGTHLLQGEGIAIDHQGNCYWSFNDMTSGGGSIVEFAGCNGSGTLLISGLQLAGGMAFDQKGDLFFLDQLVGLYGCKKTSNCTVITPNKNGTIVNFGDPVNVNFDQQDKDLWVADATGYIVAVKPTGQVESTTQAVGGPSDPPFGVAAAPGAK